MPSKLIEPKLQDQESSQGHYDFMDNSIMLKECLAERNAILKLQNTESKRLGRQISFDRAVVEWILHYKAQWQEKRSAIKT